MSSSDDFHFYEPAQGHGLPHEPILRGGGPADYFAITPDNLFKLFRPL